MLSYILFSILMVYALTNVMGLVQLIWCYKSTGKVPTDKDFVIENYWVRFLAYPLPSILCLLLS